MATINPSAIVDAVHADLALLGLDPKRVWSYVEPTVVRPADCPLLAVWCLTTAYELLTGAAGLVAYERRHQIVVDWYVTDGSELETGGTGDPIDVKELEDLGELLIERIAGYASGLPGGLGPSMVGTLESRTIEPTSGSEWHIQIHFTAEEAS